jgi:eukaryotic-like serine/threonine-protein kinase
MPAPVTCDELLDLIRRSGVVEEAKLRTHVQKLADSNALPGDPQKLAGVLVRDGVLTYFQAEQLLQGKYKRFNLGKYKVLERLGAGGMAQVFLCEHKLMRRRVAIKVLPIPKAEDPSSLKRFYREAQAIAAVDHPNIVRAYDIDHDDNLHFLVMEYVDGTNLQDLVKKFGPLDVLRACHYVYGAAVGLQHAHEMGLVHRDVKPGNILIDRAGVVKILDLGLARFFHDEEDNLTRMNDENVLGTADYLAPEQAIDSHTVDIRADIYSLGATFYYLLTGSAPFPEGSVAQKLIWHQHRVPRPIRALRPEAPEELVAVVDRMMAKDPAARYQTPAEVMAALAGWVAIPIPPPAERELPQVSLAAGGGAGRSGGAPGSGGATRTSGHLESNAPTVVARAPAPLPGAAATQPLPEAAAAAPAIWETLGADTQPDAPGDTGRPGSATQPISRLHRGTAATARKRVLLYAAVGALLLVGAATGVYLAFFNKPPRTPEPAPQQAARKTIIVSNAPGENSVKYLRDALSKANPGDRIVIAEPRLSEAGPLYLNRTRHKDVTIESGLPGGKPAVIEAGGALPSMLSANEVEGLRIRNLEFDGANRAEVGLQLSGSCPGATIEGVTIRNVKGAAIRVQNAIGEASRPILLDRVRILMPPEADGVLFSPVPQPVNRWVVIRNSRFEGRGRAGIRIDCAGSDLEITGNRFFDTDAAVTFPQLASGQQLKVQVKNNTVFEARAGFLFEFAPPEQKGHLDVKLTQNYFARTPALAIVGLPTPPGAPPAGGGAIPGVSSADNAYDPASQPGNFPLTAKLLPEPLLPDPDPGNDATFLRFPGGPPETRRGQEGRGTVVRRVTASTSPPPSPRIPVSSSGRSPPPAAGSWRRALHRPCRAPGPQRPCRCSATRAAPPGAGPRSPGWKARSASASRSPPRSCPRRPGR